MQNFQKTNSEVSSAKINYAKPKMDGEFSIYFVDQEIVFLRK